MFSELLDIEEVRTTDSVGEVNRLLQDGWDLLGFHAGPASEGGAFGSSTTIFVMGRVAAFDEDEDEAGEDFDEFDPIG